MARRANGEGTIKKTPSGKWRAVVRIDGKWISGPTVDRKIDALPMLRQKLGRESRSFTSETVQSYVLRKVESAHEAGDIKESTYALKKLLIAKHIDGSEFGESNAGTITQADFEKFRAGLAVGQHSKRNICGIVTTAFRGSISLTYPVKKVGAKSARVLTPDERTRLFNAAQGDERWLIGFLMQLGMRRGEALGVMHEDRDEDGILLTRQVIRVQGKLKVTSLKTRDSERWNALPDWMSSQIGNGEGFVIQSEPGRPQHPGWVNRTLNIVADRAGIGKVTPHDLRRTSVMAMLEAGVDIRTVAEHHGHSAMMVAEIYSQSRRDLKREAMKKVLGG